MSVRVVKHAVVAGALCLALAACGASAGVEEDNSSDVESTSAPSTATTATDATTPERSLVTAPAAGDSDVEEVQGVPEDFGVDAIVRFETGGTSTTLSSAVVRGERNRYTLEAAAGQTMIVSIVSLEDNAVFDIYGPSDVLLAAEGTTASIVLPADGNYVIIVGGTRGNASYDLTVEIPAG